MDPSVSRLCVSGVSGGVELWPFIVILILVICSAFYAACEMAYSTANLIRMRNYADDKVRGARRALQICENYDKTLTTVLVANNLINIACTTIAAYLFAQLITSPVLSNILNTVIMTILILICCEILPKSFAKMKPEVFAMRFSLIMRGTIIVLTPITWIFMQIQNIALKSSRKSNEKSPTITEDELESIIDKMEEEGVINSDDASLIQGVLDLDRKTAYDIMTHRVDISAVDFSSSPKEVYDVFVQTKYSRLPVYKGDIDHIVGIINLKDFIPEYVNNEKFNIKSVIVQPVYITETMCVDDIIRKMQKEKKHIAMVLDEHGGTSGLVSFEDALEEMVGEIYDESDIETDESIEKIEDNKYLVDAEISLNRLFELLKVEHLPETDYNSLAGYLYENLNGMPEPEQEFVFSTIDEWVDKNGNYNERAIKIVFRLVAVENRRIKKVEVSIT